MKLLNALRIFIFVIISILIPQAISAQDFLMQGWYWDFPGTPDGYNWADTLEAKAVELSNAGFTHVWLPPLSRASSSSWSNGYDPKDLYDLGEVYGGGATRFGTRADVNNVISAFNAAGIKAVSDMVYNHRDGGLPEDNPAVEGWIENFTWENANAGNNPFPSDRFRLYLPISGATGYGAGTYYFKIRSASQHSRFYNHQYRIYMHTHTVGWQEKPDSTETEPNGGGDCGEANNAITLGRNFNAYTDETGCRTDEFALTLNASDYNASGDTLWIYLSNQGGGYSDHYIYGVWYDGAGADIQGSIKYQTYTDFTNMPSGIGGMNWQNFKPNGNPTQLSGDWDGLWFYYDYDQTVGSTQTELQDWTRWMWNDVGIRGYRMDAVKHFDPTFVGDLLDNLHDNNMNPDIVVGEFYDSNAGALNNWINQTLSHMDSDTKDSISPQIFDFSLRQSLKDACDSYGYDARNVFNLSMTDNQGTSPFHVITFAGNHDFRDPGQYIENDPILAYAYILTNNQVGQPCVFYKDYYNDGLKNDINALMDAHSKYIYGAAQRDYLNRLGTPYTNNYISENPNTSLIYQLYHGTPDGRGVVVAINFAGGTLQVDHQINMTGINIGDQFVDVLGRSSWPCAVVDDNSQIYIELPPRSYSVWVQGAPEIDVTGLGNSIPDGNTTISTTDDTDFGSLFLSGDPATHTFTIDNSGGAVPLIINSVTLSDSVNYSVGSLTPASPIPTGGAATFTVSYDPTGAGTNTCTISINNGDCDENPYTFDVEGIGVDNLDYGDLPSDYALTLLTSDDGARHEIGSLYLGATIDGEFDGQESSDAGRAIGGDDGDGSDDEDGVTVHNQPWREGVDGGSIQVVVTGGSGYLSGWIDWAGNNNFTDVGDTVLDVVSLTAGTHTATFDIPSGAIPTTQQYDRFARFRLTPTNARPTARSLVTNGEVEDYYLQFEGQGPTLYINDVSRLETDSDTTAFQFTVTMSVAIGTDVTVDWATADGTGATGDSDYVGGGGSVTINAGADRTTIDVAVNGDATVEQNETFYINLSDATGGAEISDAQGLGTIQNDDNAQFSISSTSDDEANGPFTFRVSLSNPVDAPTSVTATTTDGTAQDENRDADYNSISAQVVSFNPGHTSHDVNVVINDDNRVELDEDFSITLGGLVDGGYTGIVTINAAENTGTGLIQNDDSASPEVEVHDPATNDIADDSGNYDYGNVVLSSASDATFIIHNSGNADLTLGSHTIAGANAADFTLQGAFPTSSITPSGSAMFTIRFTPGALGTRAGTISFVNGDSDENPFNFSISGQATGGDSFDKIVSTGWNMVGLPLATMNSYVDSLFPDAIGHTLYEFDGSYQPADSLKLGAGYWLRFSELDTVEIVGAAFDSVCVAVNAGWNMIAGPSCDVSLSAIIDDPENIIIDNTLYRFTGSYQSATTVEQGEGYWIRVTTDGHLCMHCNTAAVASHESIDILENTAKLIISDGNGYGQTLYFASDLTGLSREHFSLPPVPMPSAFDIRFSGNTRLTAADETVIRIQGVDYPLTISSDNLPDEQGVGYAICEMMGHKEMNRHALVDGEVIVISGSEITHLLLIRVALIPLEFAVDQNYPNPFNPITTIRYALPRASDVDIRVYNIAGQEVKILVDTRHEAGYYSVIWDGRNARESQVGSGTYFYVVKAGTDEVMRKMVLLK
ncbi:MAG: hypothetical protein B6244_11600 [Candidatus Cloacimonetes bacterium 4572_55]|nr:MAG: hypothetical protein B6244_11600 [Candidatus Cloacimonetes bacterium 4572_55]